MDSGRNLGRVSKVNIRDLAGMIAERTTSNGRRMDPDLLARRMWADTRRCGLCRKPAYVFAIYIPSESADPVMRTGLKPGQMRYFFYGLCVKCARLDDAPPRVEGAIADAQLEEANTRASLDASGARYTTETQPDGSRWIALDPPA